LTVTKPFLTSQVGDTRWEQDGWKEQEWRLLLLPASEAKTTVVSKASERSFKKGDILYEGEKD
jgi:hypothetical protein